MFVRITSQKSYRPIYITIKRLQNIICFRHRFVSFSCSSSEVRTRLTRSQNKRKEAKQPHRILSQCYAKSCSKIKLFRKFVYRATFRPVTNIIRSQPRPPTLLCLYFLTKCPAVARIADRTSQKGWSSVWIGGARTESYTPRFSYITTILNGFSIAKNSTSQQLFAQFKPLQV